MFSFQVGMIQMAADKNNVKKINQIKGCTQELKFIANKNKNKTKKREREREKMVRSTTHKVKNLKASYILP